MTRSELKRFEETSSFAADQYIEFLSNYETNRIATYKENWGKFNLIDNGDDSYIRLSENKTYIELESS